MEELISSYLDGEPISDEQKARLLELMESDTAFRNAYKATQFARNAVRASRDTVRTATPPDIRAAVLTSLRNADAPPPADIPAGLQGAAGKPPRRNILALPARYWLAAAVVIATITSYLAVDYFSGTDSAGSSQLAYVHPVDVNYRTQSYANFAAVKQGRVSFHKATSSYQELEEFFRQYGVHYDLIPPEMPAQLLGGVISEHNGHKMAHLVFNYKDTLIYMFQAPREAFSQHTVEVENEVLYIVDHGAWYWEDNIGNGTLAIWEKGATVCAIVADMTPESLQSLLKHKG